MSPQTSLRPCRGRLLVTGLLLLLSAGLSACSTHVSPTAIESAEAILAVPADSIREAVTDVLTQEGYTVDVVQEEPAALRTGYRTEIHSPWDWLLRIRWGVGRTKSEAQITALSETTAKLTVHVAHESKATMWNRWTASPAPLTQNAERYVRLVKARLGIL